MKKYSLAALAEKLNKEDIRIIPLLMMHLMQMEFERGFRCPACGKWSEIVANIAVFTPKKPPLAGKVAHIAYSLCPECERLAEIEGVERLIDRLAVYFEKDDGKRQGNLCLRKRN